MEDEMIDSTKTLHDAVRALAGRCDWAATQDGVGFNGVDAEFGHKMADWPLERWTERQYAAIHRMLAKYAKQLRGYGIDYAAIPAEKPLARGTLLPRAGADVLEARVPGVCARCGQVIPTGGRFVWGEVRGQRLHAPGCPEDVPTERIQITRDEPEWLDDTQAAVEEHGSLETAVAKVLGPGGVIARQLPGYESRPEQIAMANLVETAIAGGRHAVIEAGTGTGKSLGYLVPAILGKRKVIVSTADKGLQMQIAQKDVPFLQSVMPEPFTAVVLKGIGNYACRKRVDEIGEAASGTLEGFEGEAVFASPEAAAAWPNLLDWMKETDDGDIEGVDFALPLELREQVTTDSDGCAAKKCRRFEQCFAMRAKARAKDADVTIVNHSLLFRDLAVRHDSDGYATVLPDADVIVIDEAHHLEDQATDAFGYELTPGTWRYVERAIEKLTTDHPVVRKASDESEEHAIAEDWVERIKPVGAALTDLLAVYRRRMKDGEVEVQEIGDDRPIAKDAVDKLTAMGRVLQDSAPFWLSEEDREAWKKQGVKVESLSGMLLAIVTPNEDMVRYASLETTKKGATVVTLEAKPIEVAPELRSRLFGPLLRRTSGEGEVGKRSSWAPVVICTSATIATGNGFAYWRGRVGLDDALELEVGSPFDYRGHALLYLPSNAEDFDPRQRDAEGSLRYQGRLSEEIERLLLVSEGGAFVLFTSASMMRSMHKRLAPRLRQLVLLQGQDNMSRPELVKRFKADGNAVLFGTKSFWEGVDVQGAALRLVIVDKLPFVPPDDPIFAARRRRINRRAGREWAAFMELDVPYATIALKQGFGRLIRTKADRGVVALLDGRLSMKSYGASIVEALPPATRTTSVDAVRAFFGN
jgi:ATP-dependent DNA helicase DinG